MPGTKQAYITYPALLLTRYVTLALNFRICEWEECEDLKYSVCGVA